MLNVIFLFFDFCPSWPLVQFITHGLNPRKYLWYIYIRELNPGICFFPKSQNPTSGFFGCSLSAVLLGWEMEHFNYSQKDSVLILGKHIPGFIFVSCDCKCFECWKDYNLLGQEVFPTLWCKSMLASFTPHDMFLATKTLSRAVNSMPLFFYFRKWLDEAQFLLPQARLILGLYISNMKL